MLKKILIGLVAIIALICVAAAMQPSEFTVTRSADMNAAPEVVFAQVNDFHNWEAWSPWARLDPNAKTTFEGPASGKGAVMSWDGDYNVGKGSLTITDSVPSSLVKFHMDFIKPMKGASEAEFTFTPKDGGTRVQWTMSGHNNFMAKIVNLVMNCEKMVGEQFDKGLANLKAVVEKK